MGVFEMVTVIVIAGVVGGIVKDVMKRKSISNNEVNELRDRIAKLEAMEDRVRALEVIATDEKVGLKREINAL